MLLNPQIQDVIDSHCKHIIDELKNEMTIHVYHARSSRSVYLKFDYGAACSLRISDHPGKKHLAYRFNLIENQTKPVYIELQDGLERTFYGPADIDDLIQAIRNERFRRVAQYQDYDAIVRKSKAKARNATNGFWLLAEKVPTPRKPKKEDCHAGKREKE